MMIIKLNSYVQRYDGETKWILFLLKMMNYCKIEKIFGIKSAIVENNILIANQYTITDFWTPKENFTMIRLKMMKKCLQ